MGGLRFFFLHLHYEQVFAQPFQTNPLIPFCDQDRLQVGPGRILATEVLEL